MTDFKAALNVAYRTYRKQLPPDFGEIVRHGLSRSNNGEPRPPIARENQILPDETVRRIIRKAAELDPEGDLARFIIVLAATGARFSQIQRMQVKDVQPEHSRLLVPKSRKGKGRTEGHYSVQVGSDVLQALDPVTSGRKPDEPLLCRWRHVQVSVTEWRRDRRGPWTSSAEMTRPWRAICDALELNGVVPYALRHSSIVRGIRAGLPIRLVAALHDTSVAMIERHYARFIADGLEELAAKAVVPLVPVQGRPDRPSVAPGVRREGSG